MSSDFRDSFYADYGEFKGWDSNHNQSSIEIFEAEMKKANVPKGAVILELGFGNGEFLDWARNSGYNVHGLETNQSLVDLAKEKGHKVHCCPVQKIDEMNFHQDQFDLVVMFDLLEHLYPLEIFNLFASLRTMVKKGGRVLVRFPNGISPFGLQLQHSDMTHVTALSSERMRQVAHRTGFDVVTSSNAHRLLNYGKRPKWQRILLFKCRNIFEWVIGLLYYGGKANLDPNLVVVLEKTKP